jgi:hypothetical protein
MWEWRVFCDSENFSLLSEHKALKDAFNSESEEFRVDKYVNLNTPELGLKFRNVRKTKKKALLELKILGQTTSWKGEYWEKPIIRRTPIHPAKEVINQILGQETHSLDERYRTQINWVFDHISTRNLQFVTIQKKRKKLRLYDPNKIIRSRIKIPKAYTKFELTLITIDRISWKTLSVESYDEQTIRGVAGIFDINDNYIVSGYPGFIGRQFGVNNNP